MLIFYAGKYVNAVTAEDLVQDVFLKVWQKRTFLFLKQADNSVNTPMLPSFTSGCREPVHPGVKGGNMGVSGN